MLGLHSGASGAAAVLRTRVVDHFVASGTWTEPAQYWAPDGTPSAVQHESFGAGGGGSEARPSQFVARHPLGFLRVPDVHASITSCAADEAEMGRAPECPKR